MKRFIAVSFALMFAMNISAAKKSKVTPLLFDPDCGTKASLTMTDGKVVYYTAEPTLNRSYFLKWAQSFISRSLFITSRFLFLPPASH